MLRQRTYGDNMYKISNMVCENDVIRQKQKQKDMKIALFFVISSTRYSDDFWNTDISLKYTRHVKV